MAKINLPKFDELKGLEKNRAITDPALPNKAIAVEASAELKEKAANVSFSGSVTAAVELAIVNSVDDEDPTGILALKGKATEELEGAVIASKLEFKPGTGYVCLTGAEVAVKVGAEGSLGDLGWQFSGAAAVKLGAVRSFAGNRPVHDAIVETAEDYPTFLSVDDVLGLGSGDALLYSFDGRIGVGLTLELADLAGSIAAAAGRIVAAAGKGVKVKAGAAVSCEFAAEDSFRLVATSAGAGKIRIAVRKQDERSLSVGASVGLDVKLDDKQLLAPLDALTTSLFKYPWKRLEPLIDKAADELNEAQRKIVDWVLSQAGKDLTTYVPKLDEELGKLVGKAKEKAKKALEDALKLEDFKRVMKGLRDALAKELKKTLAAKWAFNYSRISTQSAILQAVLDEPAFRKLHRSLLKFQLDPVLTAAAADDGVIVEQFLANKTQTVKLEYGLSLSWGDFTVLAGSTVNERQWTELTDQDRRRKRSFTAKRGYTSTWLGEKLTHHVTYGATMPGFSPKDPVPAIDYEVGLALSFTWDRLKFDDEAVLQVADHAAVVGAIGPDEMDETLDALRSQHGIKASDKGSAIVHVQAENDLLVQLLPVIAAAEGIDLTARALGAALAYRGEKEYSLRQSVAARSAAYAPAWKAYLLDEDASPEDLARMAWTALVHQHKRLADFERDFVLPQGDRAWTAGAMARLHSGAYPFRDSVKALWLGIAHLQARVQSGASDGVIVDAYDDLKQMWTDHYPSRVFGALLVEAARRVPLGLERLQRRLEFRLGDTKIVFARGTA